MATLSFCVGRKGGRAPLVVSAEYRSQVRFLLPRIMSASEYDIFLSVRGGRRVGVGNGAGVRTRRGPLGEEDDDDDGWWIGESG